MSKLYILMRTDLTSMNPGKAMAQAAHAGTHFIFHHRMKSISSYNKEISNWLGSEGFGTKIVIGIPTLNEMRELVGKATSCDYIANIIVDSSYPLKDGAFVHSISVETCGYIFDHNNQLHLSMPELKNYNLR